MNISKVGQDVKWIPVPGYYTPLSFQKGQRDGKPLCELGKCDEHGKPARLTHRVAKKRECVRLCPNHFAELEAYCMYNGNGEENVEWVFRPRD